MEITAQTMNELSNSCLAGLLTKALTDTEKSIYNAAQHGNFSTECHIEKDDIAISIQKRFEDRGFYVSRNGEDLYISWYTT